MVRSLVAWLVALALASAPTLGVAWPDVRSGDLAEQGAAAGLMPFVADPGHRMGVASLGSAAPSTAGTLAAWYTGPSHVPAKAERVGAEVAYHGWLRTMLVGSRLQTDGG